MFHCSSSPQEPVFHTKSYPCRLSAWQTLSGLLLCWLLNTGHYFHAQMTRPSSSAFPKHGMDTACTFFTSLPGKKKFVFSFVPAWRHKNILLHTSTGKAFAVFLAYHFVLPWTLSFLNYCTDSPTLQPCKMKGGTGTISSYHLKIFQVASRLFRDWKKINSIKTAALWRALSNSTEQNLPL